jgi:hypothetical protein
MYQRYKSTNTLPDIEIPDNLQSDTYFYSQQQKQYIGYDIENFPQLRYLYGKKVIDFISQQCTLLLKGVHFQGKDIIIPDNRIVEVMNTAYLSFNPPTGFDAPLFNQKSYTDSLIKQVIERIVFDVSNTLAIEQNNFTQTVWTTVLGDFNQHHLRAHAPIKLKNKRPSSFQFNMKY